MKEKEKEKETEADTQPRPKQYRDVAYHIETLNKILAFRGMRQAPVDTMGCDQLYDDKVNTLTQKFQILISIMLSVQTMDETTSVVVQDMIAEGIVNPETMAKMTPEELEPKIRRVNYHKTKAKNLIKAAQYFLDHGSPKTYKEVSSLSGVGMKVGTLYVKIAEGSNEGIGVDTHLHRITNRLAWVQTKNPVDTELRLREVFPSEYWRCMNHAIVGFGQLICVARKPRCGECPVSDRCPSSRLYD